MVQLTITGERAAAADMERIVETLDGDELPPEPAGTSSAGASTSASDMPALAAIHRERAVKRKAPEGPRGRSKCGRTTKEMKVMAVKRLSEFCDQGLTISAGKLYCQACHEIQPNLKESIKRHLLTSKHIKNLEIFFEKEEASQKVKETLSQHFLENIDEKGVRSPVA